MNRTQSACCVLLASAFVLGGLLIVRAQDRWLSPVYADMVVNKGPVSAVTARTGTDEEALFVLDDFNETILIYRADIGHGELELAGTIDIPSLMAHRGGGRGPDGGRSRGR